MKTTASAHCVHCFHCVHLVHLVHSEMRMLNSRCFHACLAVIACSLICGCENPPTKDQDQPSRPAPFLDAQKAFLEGDYDGASLKFQAAAKEQPGLAAQTSYWIGVCRLKQGRIASAQDAFRQCLATGPDDTLRLKALAGIGNCQQQAGRYDLAARTYSQVLASPSKSIERDLITFNYGLCLLKTGDAAKGRAALQDVIGKYPSSPWAPAARRRMKNDE